MNSITTTKSWLQSRCILIPDDWLVACIEWIQEENQGTDLNQERLNDMVYEQWLLSDLHELGTSCLPGNIATDAKYRLTGAYALQIDSVIDVSQSFYSQQQKLKGTENANVNVTADKPTQNSWEPKATRMLMLKLTDGSVSVQGMEYRSIPQLSVTTQPGCKILVQGQILCRHGVLMLSGSDLKVLGGEVDTLMEQNTPENVLHSAMESSSKNVGKQIKQEFADSQIQKLAQRAHKNSGQTMQGIRQIQQFPQANKIPIDNKRIKIEPTDFTGSTQHIIHGQGQTKMETSVPMEMDEQMWEDDFNYDDLLEDMSTIAPEPRTVMQRKTEVTEPSRPQNSFQANNASISRLSTKVPGSEKTINKDKFPLDITNSKSVQPTSRGIKVETENETLYRAFGMGESDFDDDMYDFDMETAINEDPLTNSANEHQGSQKESKPSSTWVNNVARSASVHQSVTGLKTSEHAQNVSFNNSSNRLPINVKNISNASSIKVKNRSPVKVKNISNRSPVKVKKEHMTPPNTLDKYFGSTASGSGSGNRPEQFSRLNLIEQFTGLKHRELPAAIDVSSPELLREKFFSMRTTQQPGATNKVGLDIKPFTYLSVLQKHLPAIEYLQCSVKAYISTLTGRLDCKEGKIWHLTCKINDGSASIEVDLSNQVLTGLIGFSAEESMIMRKRIKDDPSVKEVLTEGLQQCQQKLIDLCCLMELEVMPHQQRPEVKSIQDITRSHIDSLYKRVSQKGCIEL